MELYRVLVTGDRNWSDLEMVYRIIMGLYAEHGDGLMVIHGAARGADHCADTACHKLEIPVLLAPARWNKYHKAAGPIRNGWMLKYGQPHVFYAFHDDLKHSKGTLDMVTRCVGAGIPGYHYSHGADGSEQVQAL